ncbi:MAG TPA: hypothetical protein VFS60_14455 [Thermoanaerobaculia bacterium]|nr:hypothetical protein [Thermoanaerobaculia bacterium]
MPTEIWVANGQAANTAASAGFVRGAGAKSRSFEVAPGGRLLGGLAGRGEIGLVEVDAEEMAVSAWIPAGDGVSEVPVIGEQDSYHAGAEPGLEVARDYDRLLVGAANVSDRATSCHAMLFDESNVEIARIPFEVAAKSLARHDAAGWLGAQKAAYAQVGCDREFYPVAVTTQTGSDGATRAIVAKGTGPNGTCKQIVTLAQLPGDRQWGATVQGLVHQATRSNPKGIVCIKAPQQLNIGVATYEWDVTVGPWSARDKSGVHNAAYFFLERYRSGVIGNINVVGPNKDQAKWMQNVGMPRGNNTVAKAGFKAARVLYHMIYTFDANNKSATWTIQDAAHVTLATVSGRTSPGNNQTLIVKPYGSGGLAGLAMVAEFGNYLGQHHPEEATIDWTYANFRVTLIPKQ